MIRETVTGVGAKRMKRRTIIGGGLAAPILVFVLFVGVACNSPKSESDTDTVRSDSETIAVVDDTLFIEGENDAIDDVLISDSDAADCPSLATAPFPYYKEDGTIHFCRGCDTPTEKDPQCMRNLWEEQNKKLAKDHPEYDCYPYPCEMTKLKPMTKAEVDKNYTSFSIHECDLSLNPLGWYHDGTNGSVKHWNLSGGIIGFHMTPVTIAPADYMTGNKAFTYDIEQKSYLALGPMTADMLSYRQGKMLLFSADFRSLELGIAHEYVGYYGTDGSYRVVYPKPIYFIAYTPANNENWVFANIQETDGGSYRMMYAKVGEWKWTSLGDGMGYYPDLQDNLLGVGDDTQGYVCDLSKTPQSLSACSKVARDKETAYVITFDKENENVFVYSSNVNRAITRVDMRGAAPVYEDIVIDFSSEIQAIGGYSLVPRTLRGKTLLYTEVGGGGSTARACFYRLDTKKRYCMKMIEKDNVYKYGYAEFEGKWLLYQRHASTPLVLRDMACYCEKEGICPFEGMKK